MPRRRKPPKHLPKTFPEDHFLFGRMTPKEWVGMQIDTLHIAARRETMFSPVGGQNYRQLMRSEGEALTASFDDTVRRVVEKGYTTWDGVRVWNRSTIGRDWRSALTKALRDDQHLKADETPVWVKMKPYGVWPKIFDAAREKVQAEFGISVSDRTLKGCLAAFRAWRRPTTR
jgi:hypothetical protein